MPLSDEAKQSLDNSARISNLNKEKKKAEGIQQEGDRRQSEEEYNAFQKGQLELQKQITDLENQEKAQALEIANEEARKQKIIDDRNSLNASFDVRIAEINKQRETAIQSVRNNYISRNMPGGISRRQLSYNIMAVNRNYNYAVDKISRDKARALDQYEFSVKYPGARLGGSASRTYAKSGGRMSLIALYESQQSSFEAKRLSQRAHAIAISKSQLNNDSAKWKETASKLAQQKEENDKAQASKIIFNKTPTKAGDLKKKATAPERQLFQPAPDEIKTNLPALKSYQATQQAKATKLKEVMATRQKIEPIERPQPIQNKSNAFLTKAPVYGSSIIGTNVKQSDKAVYTFEETQQQQKELSDKIRNAPNSREATRLKEEAQALNPYVGTPQLARTKDGTASQGVLIDLKLNIEKEDTILETAIEQPKPRPTDPTTITTWNVTIGDRTITGIKDEETANKLIARFNRTEEQKATPIEFLKDGAPYKPTIAELFSYNNYLLSQSPPKPSQADIELNKLLRADPNSFSFDPSELSGETKAVNLENTYAVANKDPVNRGILNVVVKPDQTMAGKGIEDVIAVGTSAFNNEPLPKESKLYNFIDTKLKTDEGRKELIGEVIGEYALARAFSGVPSLVNKVYHAGIITPQTLKIAEKIAEGIRISGRDPATEKLLAKFPDMPEAMKNKIRNQNNKETVGIEMLDSRTALIKRGTELNEVQTPYIVVKNEGKNRRFGTLYETYTTDKPGAYSKILISGEQKGELSGGVKQSKDIIEYKATRDNIIKSQDISKLAQVGTAEKVGIEGLKETPIAVITKIETQEIKSGSIILETERLNKIKSMNQQVKGLDKIDDVTPGNTKPFKPDTKTTGNKINVDLPTGKPNITVLKEGATQRRETLEGIIKATNKESINLKTNSLNKLAGISIITSTQATRSIQSTGATQRQHTQQAQQITTQQTQRTEIKTGLESGSKLRTDEIIGLKSDMEQLQKQKPTIDPKYSLITKPGLNDKQQTIPLLGSELDQPLKQDQSFELVLKQETALRTPTPTKTTTTTTTTRPGFAPILNIKTELERNANPNKGKLKIGFYRYNVNTDSVGRYIEQAPDISTGKTRKTIDKIDQLERRINTPQYARKQTKREQKQYKREMQLEKKGGGSLESRMHIPNISEPKGKKAQKQLKKLGFKLNIF